MAATETAMMALAHPRLALRPMLPADVSVLREIFRDSVEELTADDYTLSQQEAWASVADDEAAFGKKLAGQLTLVATLETSPVGFASLTGGDTVDMLYVHPAAAGQGVAAMLADALEKLAGSRGAAVLKVDASDSARGFFEKRGYVAQQRNTVSVGDEWLANTTLHKQLDKSLDRSLDESFAAKRGDS
jgi:putative acetyltransferase